MYGFMVIDKSWAFQVVMTLLFMIPHSTTHCAKHLQASPGMTF